MIWQKNSPLSYKIKMLWQRITRGFSDYETYTFQEHFAKWIVPRLKHALGKKKSLGYSMPVGEWEKMIKGFELIDGESDNIYRPGTKEHEAVKESLQLLEKWFWGLSY